MTPNGMGALHDALAALHPPCRACGGCGELLDVEADAFVDCPTCGGTGNAPATLYAITPEDREAIGRALAAARALKELSSPVAVKKRPEAFNRGYAAARAFTPEDDAALARIAEGGDR